ncbi:MAG: hypothetical protein ACK5O2_04730 [Microthrixaceae bacterium]
MESLPKPIGFVLGGDDSLGAQQVGQLQALCDGGIITNVGVLDALYVAITQ